jgi:3-oxoacyl-[acyl-carrier protein] reductase
MIETGLSGKVVIVTGGAGGIGRATARRFAMEGCKVAVWDVAEAAAPAVTRELTEAGGEALFQKIDVVDSKSVEEAVAGVVQRWGNPYVLVNNAGILRDGLLVKYKEGQLTGSMSDEVFDSVISVNLRGVFVCTRTVVPRMVEGGGGVILNASSVVGLYGNFGQTNYVATKFGVIGMTKTWARELGRHNIRVNAVAPGYIGTEMVKAMPENILATMKQHTPLRRMGEPEDIANAYLWLASDASSFVTGAVLSVDGGVVVGT